MTTAKVAAIICIFIVVKMLEARWCKPRWFRIMGG